MKTASLQKSSEQYQFGFRERTKCPACHSQNIKDILKHNFTDPAVFDFISKSYPGISKVTLGNAPYIVSKCSECDVLFQKHVLSDEDADTLYETIIDPKQSLNKREQASHSYFAGLFSSANFIKNFFPNQKPRDIDVLDFGMGWGHWSMMAQALGYNVYGAELSKSRIAFAKDHGICVIENLEANEQTFDFIHTEQVFEHLMEPHEIGVLLKNKLKPGGILKIAVPNSNTMLQKIQALEWRAEKDGLQPLEHVNCFSWPCLMKFAKVIGLEPVNVSDLKTLKAKLLCLAQFTYRKNSSWYFIKRA